MRRREHPMPYMTEKRLNSINSFLRMHNYHHQSAGDNHQHHSSSDDVTNQQQSPTTMPLLNIIKPCKMKAAKKEEDNNNDQQEDDKKKEKSEKEALFLSTSLENSKLQRIVQNNGDAPYNGNLTKGKMLIVSRYGKIYKRRLVPRLQLPKIVPQGKRWCRMCEGFLDLDAFYSTSRRFVCKKHHSRESSLGWTKRFSREPSSLQRNVNFTFDYMHKVFPTVGFEAPYCDITDIKLLVTHAGIPWELKPVVCPIDPCVPIWPHNLAIVSKNVFELLVELYMQSNSRALYIAYVQRCNLLPTNFDASLPVNPMHNAKFRRKEFDIAQLLQEEKSKPIELMDFVIMEEISKQGNVPWLLNENKEAIAIAIKDNNNNNLEMTQNEKEDEDTLVMQCYVFKERRSTTEAQKKRPFRDPK